MRLSVIVPVFNAEAYLPRCLDSLLKQGMKAEEWEVICVDDGSTDRSPRILAEYAHLHPTVFRVVRQERRGPGIARNSGLDVAQGEYVTFADADDYVLAGGYRYLYDHYCAGRQPDVLAFASVELSADASSSFFGKTIVWMKNLSGRSYIAYLLARQIYERLFKVFILPRISE